jgi:hypothetical protein
MDYTPNDSTIFNRRNKTRVQSKSKKIVLPWFTPGPLIKLEKIKFSTWDWANLRDSMYIFSYPYCDVVSNRGFSVKDNRCAMMQVSKSMWNIQGYTNLEMWDSVAMEGRIILESVCTYLNRCRPIQLKDAIEQAIHNHPSIQQELGYIRHIGCLGVHFQDVMDSSRIFRTDKKSVTPLIQAVYVLIKKMESVIQDEYRVEYQNALIKLMELREKLSPDRLNCSSNEQIKIKSCADEAKPNGCKKKKNLGCPYLHKGDCGFNFEDAVKNLEMLRNFKNKQRGGCLNLDEDYSSDEQITPVLLYNKCQEKYSLTDDEQAEIKNQIKLNSIVSYDDNSETFTFKSENRINIMPISEVEKLLGIRNISETEDIDNNDSDSNTTITEISPVSSQYGSPDNVYSIEQYSDLFYKHETRICQIASN